MMKIILVDDHPMFLNGLAALLGAEANIEIVGQATDGKQALDMLAQCQPDVLVMDISMPDMDGIALNKEVKDLYPQVKTLVLSTYNDSETIEKLIRKDVDGYLLKIAEKDELLLALEAVSHGKKYFSSEVKEHYMRLFFGEKTDHEPKIQKLSRREREILHYMTKELTAKEIAEALFISNHTVHTHKKNLMAKLKVKNSAGLVRYAIENGFAEEH